MTSVPDGTRGAAPSNTAVKVSAAVLAFAAALVVLYLLLVHTPLQRGLPEHNREQGRAVFEPLATQIEDWTRGAMAKLQEYAGLPGMLSFDSAEMERSIAELEQVWPRTFAGLFVLDTKGNCRACPTVTFGGRKPTSLARADMFRKVRDTLAPHIGGTGVWDRLGQRWFCVEMSAPIFDPSGQWIGVLVGAANVYDRLPRILYEGVHEDYPRAMLIAADGVKIGDSNRDAADQRRMDSHPLFEWASHEIKARHPSPTAASISSGTRRSCGRQAGL